MQIIIKNGDIARHQMHKQIAKPVAFNILKNKFEFEQAKATRTWKDNKPGSSTAFGRFDTVEAAKNARLLGKNLDNVHPETLSASTKDKMWIRAKQLKDEFIVGMLSHEELHPVKGFKIDGVMKWVVDEEKMRSLNSVARNEAWYKRNESKTREFKNIMRHLCPQDPNAGDIERFRPKLRGVR